MFCSSECQSAAHSKGLKAVSVCFIILGVGLLFPSILASIFSPSITSTGAVEVFFYGLLVMTFGFCGLAEAVEAKSYRDRKDKYRNAELLVCEYCNHINNPGVVACDNCGATLVGARFAIDPWPDWFPPPPELKATYPPCRNCGRKFRYAVLSADGKHRCPKCGNSV
jgi:uncharacterized paraquat-inducible protein A